MSTVAKTEMRFKLVELQSHSNDVGQAHWPREADQHLVPRPRFVATMMKDSGVGILRVVEVDDVILAGSVLWSRTYENEEEARRRFVWLDCDAHRCSELGAIAYLFGPDEITAEIEVGIEIERAQKEQAAYDMQRASLMGIYEESDAPASKLEILLYDRNQQYGLCIKPDRLPSIWVILFREKWERERFRDYFRWQRHRLNEFAEYLVNHEPIELERMLLGEMLEAERSAKRAGKSDRGRRPLRLWRGEAW